jgi:hypothetical protein
MRFQKTRPMSISTWMPADPAHWLQGNVEVNSPSLRGAVKPAADDLP